MLRYLLRRLLTTIPLLLAIATIAFVILRLIPGGPFDEFALRNPHLTAEQVAAMEENLGLRDPLPVQYVRWLPGALTGDWGVSYLSGRPAFEVVLERLPNTILLTLTALVVSMALGIPIGVLAATRPHSLTAYIAQALAVAGVSMPTFWLGLMVILVFAEGLGWLPTGGMFTIGAEFSVQDRFIHLVGPALVLAIPSTAEWVRYTYATMLEVMQEDYVRTARAKGLTERLVRNRHAFRNVLITLVTLLGLNIPWLFSGAVVTESVFSWPGNGRLLLESLFHRDHPVVMGSFMIIAAATVLGNLLADLAYGILDPRVRYE